MYGAILGDIIGSPFEFDQGDKTKDFPLFSAASYFTDDSVMTAAVAAALLESGRMVVPEVIRALVTKEMRAWGKKYPDAGYGAHFSHWLSVRHPEPYNSFGNGSAMRVSAAGWLYGTLKETRLAARATAEVTHNHAEGIKGAEAVAGCIFLARHGASKDEIRAFVEKEFGYDLSVSCDEIRPAYHHVESCQESVPPAIRAFLEGESFEDVIRLTASLGGDTDTTCAIAGSIAEAFYGIPAELIEECQKRIPKDIRQVADSFYAAIEKEEELKNSRALDKYALELERALYNWYRGGDKAPLEPVFNAIMYGSAHNMEVLAAIETPSFIFENAEELKGVDPSSVEVHLKEDAPDSPEGVKLEELRAGQELRLKKDTRLRFRRFMGSSKDSYVLPVFTSLAELACGGGSSSINVALQDILVNCENAPHCEALVINPFGNLLRLPHRGKDLIKVVLGHKPKSHITTVKGSVLDLHVGAIVNSASGGLNGQAGLDRAVHKAAGAKLTKACSVLGKLRPGEAKITSAYNIENADYIIHAAGPEYKGTGKERALIESCYFNALDLALEYGVTSIALPFISAGSGGAPVDAAVAVALLAAVKWLNAHKDKVIDIYFCCYTDEEYKAMQSLTKR